MTQATGRPQAGATAYGSMRLTTHVGDVKILYSKIYMETAMRKDKNIMIRVSRDTHTAFKKKAAGPLLTAQVTTSPSRAPL
mgnify:CR=1 FL=1